ncbi:MAG: NAD(P)-dependent oxidoreductase [Candidatus Gracilibacteria bacterium]
MTNIYILGGEGFIGKNLIDFFSTNTNFNIYSVSRKKSLFSSNESININYIFEDIYKCKFKFEEGSIIIHLARPKFITEEKFYNDEIKLKNYVLTFNPKQLIIFSSSVVYINSNSIYKTEKKILEKVWSNPNSCIVRLFNTYGKYQLPFTAGSLVSTIFYNQIILEETTINDVTQLRNFIYAFDIGKILLEVINNRINGVIDLGGVSTISIKELIFNIGKVIKLNTLKIIDNKEETFLKEPNNLFDIEYTDINKGLKETLEFLQNNIKLIQKKGQKK